MAEPQGPVRREGERRTVLVTLLVCLACAILVATAASVLGPIRDAKRRAGSPPAMRALLQGPHGLRALLPQGEGAELVAHVIDLETGEVDPSQDAASFDALAAARDPARSVAIPAERDVARLGRRERHAVVYPVRQDGRLAALLLPIRGRGYASTIQGFLALGPDLNTVLGISFHEHGETPGIGTEIEKPAWRTLWEGKQVRDEAGAVQIRVVDPSAPPDGDARFRVDGISGATRSSQGVGHMVRFWMGDDGFGPYLARLKEAP
jgi:Na+-transporting NADH:ubiquinone oxidoreductase subunit C